MLQGDRIWMAQGDNPCYLLLNQANRHGLISGASGTGKTVTLKIMAEGLSKAGVPVFMADVKGDVTGMAQPGVDNENMQKRIAKFGLEGWTYEGCPCRFWDVAGGWGIPIRITVSDMGPMLLSRLLGLSDVQAGVLNVVFRVADDMGMLLIDLKDLRAMLNYVGEHAKEFEFEYGHVATQSIGAILRELIAVEDQGGDIFFGEPAIDLNDWFATDEIGHGYVNILNASQLINTPQIYAMFLLWMMSELFETLPEVGDPEKPRFVFFFDEAHLLFNGMPKELLDKLIQVVKLIRSKGVGIYFITQSPSDIPNEVLAQLSNRIQHGLRAYTPAEQKAVRAAAETFRANPKFDSAKAILELGTGEALVSFLDEEGRPSIVENAKMLPPQCLMAAADDEVIEHALGKQTALDNKYGNALDRESAYELIIEKRAEEEAQAELEYERAQLEKERAEFEAMKVKEEERARKEAEKKAAAEERARQRQIEQMERKRLKELEAEERKRIQAQERARQKAYNEEMRRREKERQQREKELNKALNTLMSGGKSSSSKKRSSSKSRSSSSGFDDMLDVFGRQAGDVILRNIFGSRKRW
ncbi:MAG: DUF853 domain-containing protein [bacterium]|nr:DUF853 domain-containing protein [bacterium]